MVSVDGRHRFICPHSATCSIYSAYAQDVKTPLLDVIYDSWIKEFAQEGHIYNCVAIAWLHDMPFAKNPAKLEQLKKRIDISSSDGSEVGCSHISLLNKLEVLIAPDRGEE